MFEQLFRRILYTGAVRATCLVTRRTAPLNRVNSLHPKGAVEGHRGRGRREEREKEYWLAPEIPNKSVNLFVSRPFFSTAKAKYGSWKLIVRTNGLIHFSFLKLMNY